MKQQAQQEGYPAKDPAQNWSGSPCHFFTCPYERRDRNDNVYGYNSYANESVVRYGRWQYTCVAGRWKVSGSASGPVDAARADASVGEMKCQNKYGAPLDSVFMYEGE